MLDSCQSIHVLQLTKLVSSSTYRWWLSLQLQQPHPLQISFGCHVEGVKRTGQDKGVHAGSISPRPEILAGPTENGQHSPEEDCLLLTYIA